MDDTAAKSSGYFRLIRKSGIPNQLPILLAMLFFLLLLFGCAKEDNLALQNDMATTSDVAGDKIKAHYEVTNLVSDVSEYNPEIIDTNLVNAWGIAISPTGVFWISAADKQRSVVYNDEGETLRPPVTMDGEPTGQVFNPTTG